MKIYYRKEIDGLRALAVIPVVFYHAGFEIFSGGFIGVDVFFVISGYLITNIIYDELIKKKFTLKNFYERRARRILPALFTVIIFSSILAFLIMTKSEINSYFRSIIATLFFFSNFHFWKNAPYFSSEVDLQPLIHTWSLSIEEQFYIVFPLFLIISFKFFKRLLLPLILIFLSISLYFCILLSFKTGGNLNFYFTLSRGWELLTGALISILSFKGYLKNSNKILSELFSILGLFLIFIPIFFLNKQSTFPGLSTLFPVIGTSLIIIFSKENSFTKKILSNKFFVFVGLISYSFYLWHQPLLAFGNLFFENFNFKLKLISITIAFILSYLSWNFIEKVFRNKKIINIKFLIKSTISYMVVFLIFSLLCLNVFNKNSFNSTESKLAKLLKNNNSIYSMNMDERQFIKNRIIFEEDNPEVIVIGSSRLMQVSNDTLNKKTLNLSVSGANMEDQIAITELALEKFKPNFIILGADPWLFNKFNYESRWKSLSKEYFKSIYNIYNTSSRKNFNNSITNKEKENNFIINIYEKVNIRKLDLIVNANAPLPKMIIKKDGSRIYSEKDKLKNIQPKIIDRSMYKYQFSNKRYKTYTDFLNYLTNSREVNVKIILTPYHHESYILTLKNKPEYKFIEEKFTDLRFKNIISVLGSYDPKKTFCKTNEFYDAEHPKGSCMQKILSPNFNK